VNLFRSCFYHFRIRWISTPILLACFDAAGFSTRTQTSFTLLSFKQTFATASAKVSRR